MHIVATRWTGPLAEREYLYTWLTGRLGICFSFTSARSKVELKLTKGITICQNILIARLFVSRSDDKITVLSLARSAKLSPFVLL